MSRKTLLPTALQSFDYYTSKLPLYLQNSYGIIEHFRILYEILEGSITPERTLDNDLYVNGILISSDTLLYLLDIYDDNFLEVINQMSHTNDKSDILDKIGLLYGVRRNFKYNNHTYNLNNSEFLILVKCEIIKRNYDGSQSEIFKLYNTDIKLPVLYVTDTDTALNCDVYLDTGNASLITQNIQNLFLDGLLTIESLGIVYNKSAQVLTKILYWNVGRWASGVPSTDKTWSI